MVAVFSISHHHSARGFVHVINHNLCFDDVLYLLIVGSIIPMLLTRSAHVLERSAGSSGEYRVQNVFVIIWNYVPLIIF